ncbi:MAG: LysR family transcriptional regulator [Stenomitos rutilans HA7619-LM2]|jgi:DNA-binding transcriptional LysR family regulator|nr:LysR family transcriptional regulator [Stenomitos rutilans HA7619-LM2]
MDTLVSMRVFRWVVELESFVAAADRMEMSAAMVSKHVMHLERHLGGRLLNRTSRHLSLTESGTIYFEQCCEMLDRLNEVEATVSRAAVVPNGVLKMSAPDWFANRIFTQAIADYRTQFPEVTLEIDLSGRIVNLVEEGFDLALRATHREPSRTLIYRAIAPIQLRIVAAPAYLHRAGKPTQPEALAQHAMMTYSVMPESKVPLIGSTGKISAKFSSVPVLRTNNVNLIHEATVNGMGISLLPTWLIDNDLATGALEEVLPEYHLPPSTLYAVYPSRKYLSSKVRTFVEFMIDRFTIN